MNEGGRDAWSPVEDVSAADEILDVVADSHDEDTLCRAQRGYRPNPAWASPMGITFGHQFWASGRQNDIRHDWKKKGIRAFRENWLGNLDSQVPFRPQIQASRGEALIGESDRGHHLCALGAGISQVLPFLLGQVGFVH